MAITAKCDAFIVNPTTDVQPAAGEIWLITAFGIPGPVTDMNAQSIGLWDGTDLATLFDTSSANTAISGTGADLGGNTTGATWQGNSSVKVVITNTVRLRFTSNGYVFGYTGVLLS